MERDGATGHVGVGTGHTCKEGAGRAGHRGETIENLKGFLAFKELWVGLSCERSCEMGPGVGRRSNSEIAEVDR
jgi:hypothetical protein